jgi:hypothetical protein
MAKPLAPYRTYIIRSWEEPCRGSQSGAAIYRFSLEIPATGERFGFTCSEDLIQALKAALAQSQTEAIADKAAGEEPD